MDSQTSAKWYLDQAMISALVGNNNAALDFLGSASYVADHDKEKLVQTKAQVLLNLGQYQQAVDHLAEVSVTDQVTRLLFARALFLNGENERSIIEL